MLVPGIQLLGMQKIAIARMNMCCRMHTNRVAFSKKAPEDAEVKTENQRNASSVVCT